MDLLAGELLLPEGILGYFEVVSVEKAADSYIISLVEKHLQSCEFPGLKLNSHGFHNETTIKDFPLRGKACYLKVKPRRWVNEDTDDVIFRNWELVAKGKRMTKEFAAFLKVLHRQHPSKL